MAEESQKAVEPAPNLREEIRRLGLALEVREKGHAEFKRRTHRLWTRFGCGCFLPTLVLCGALAVAVIGLVGVVLVLI